jgi:hypothetical protein
MIHVPDIGFTNRSQRARDEVAAAWEHLLTAAEQTARQVGETSRRRGKVARDRTSLARRAILGELSPTPWRWLGVGLAAGAVLGATGALVLARRRAGGDQETTDQAAGDVNDHAVNDRALNDRTPAVAAAIRAKAGVAAEAVREGTNAAVHGAAAAAREAAAKVRERIPHRDSTDEAEPPGSQPPAGGPTG